MEWKQAVNATLSFGFPLGAPCECQRFHAHGSAVAAPTAAVDVALAAMAAEGLIGSLHVIEKMHAFTHSRWAVLFSKPLLAWV